MARVHVLDSTIANRIAAGEVVERPSGVVKELVENAIDAGATRIEVRIKQGGIEEIQVIDDGCGMDSEDAILAFERHATSKIIQESDLWNIHTLGFRGEALPSIASVSDVEMFTCDGKEGTHIHLNNGKVIEKGSASFRVGTQMIVRDLFFAIPARLKHLKAVPYEISMVNEIVSKLALANPTIAFTFYSDDKEMFRSSGNGDYITLLYSVYGKEVAKSAIPVEVSDDDFKISGYICLPSVTRSNRKTILTFMNSRIIVNYYLQSAILNGYQEYIPEKRYPLVFLNIEMSASLVDVNVHPSKWEVRLSKEKQLYGLMENAIHHTLAEHMHKQSSLISNSILSKEIKEEFEVRKQQSEVNIVVEEKQPVKVEQPALFDYEYRPTAPLVKVAEKKVAIEYPQYETKKQEITEIVEKKVDNVENVVENVEKHDVFVDKSVEKVENHKGVVEKNEEYVENSVEEPIISIPFDVIGQLHGSYILASNEEGLVIIDQHAANERIRYEEVRKAFENRAISSQPLLVPYVLSVNRSVMIHFDRVSEALQVLGFIVDQFGENELIVRETPLWMQVQNEEQFIQDLIDRIMDEKKIELTQLKKHALATLACHSSIRFNRVLSKEEMEETIRRLMQCENPYHCPHGRPTYIVYEDNKLRKLFERG